MTHTQTENPDSQPTEADELRDRVRKLEAQLAERDESIKSHEDRFAEARRRIAELKSQDGHADPQLKPHLQNDIDTLQAAVDSAAIELKKRPQDNSLLLAWTLKKNALRTAKMEMESRFPQPEIVPRSLSRLQSEQLHELRIALDAAKADFMRDTRCPFKSLKFNQADRAFKSFSRKLWAEHGIRISH